MSLQVLNGQSLKGRRQQREWSTASGPVARPTSDLALIITCHAPYVPWLADAIGSVDAQTVQPREKVIALDGCDCTPPAGWQVVRGNWSDLAKARNAGGAVTCSPWVLCMDADDMLAPDYIAKLFAAPITERTGWVYPVMVMWKHGTPPAEGSPRPVIAYDPQRMIAGNYMAATSMVRRVALDQAGGWQGRQAGHEDWMLWLRLSRLAWEGVAAEARLFYRQHPDSMKHEKNLNVRNRAMVIHDAMLTTIITPFSGREWSLALYKRWLGELEWPKENLHVLAVDNSCNNSFRSQLETILREAGFSHGIVTVSEHPFTDESERRDALQNKPARKKHAFRVSGQVARLWAIARERMPARTQMVATVEDDILPRKGWLLDLARGFINRHTAGMVSGAVPSRFYDGIIGAEFPTGPEEDGMLPVDHIGFGCALFTRAAWEAAVFRCDTASGEPNYDWHACCQIRRSGLGVWLKWSVACEHWGCRHRLPEPHEIGHLGIGQ